MPDTSRIRILPDVLVNKIAAGEVVERPASVVKELVENALDAGASRIAVTIENGGRDLIRVTDNGGGMSAEALRLAIHPHATSKLPTEDHLYRIGTLGFRGEALASISAVSRLRIVSRPTDAVEGHEIQTPGEPQTADNADSSEPQVGTRAEVPFTIRPAGCPVGTTVEVRDLFYNVPARRKFLKAPPTEVGHVHEQFARLALAFPQVAFELTNNRRQTQNLPAVETRRERIARFYGPELAEALIPIQRDERGVSLDIYAAPPGQSRATAQWQYTFVNGRYVRDRYMQHAIREAYRGLLEPNRHGVIFLFLSIDPEQLDVNVHPTKIEVRWADANLIHSQVLSALRETFQRSNLAPALRTDRARDTVSEAEQERIRREVADLFRQALPAGAARADASAPTGALPASGFADGAARETGLSDASRAQLPPGMDPLQVWRSLYGPMDSNAPGGSSRDDESATAGAHPSFSADRFAAAPDDGPPRRAVQMHNLYLVVETNEGIVIVDQHALHERVIYEQLQRRMAAGELESQRLLLPETLKVTAEEADRLDVHADLLRRLGLEVSPFGTDAVAVHAFPAMLRDVDVAGFLRDLLDRLADQGDAAGTDLALNGLLSMMACKAAVKAGDRLNEDEIESLVAQRHLLEKPSSCPHGRPTMLRLTKADLNRQFHRT